MERVLLDRLLEELRSLTPKEKMEFASEMNYILKSAAIDTSLGFGKVAEKETEIKEDKEKLTAKEITTQEIRNFVGKLGIPTNIIGYGYTIDAVRICLDDPGAVGAWIKYVYTKVAEKNNTTHARVERSIRHAVELSCKRAKEGSVIYDIFKLELQNGINFCNRRFITGIVEHLKQMYHVN